jgi:hypothetical protein
MQGREQSTFTDDERRAPRFLLSQESGRCHSTSEDMLLLCLDAHAGQLGGDIAPRALAVVREE